MNAYFFRYALCISVLAIPIFTHSQVVTQPQLATCEKYKELDRCPELVNEFFVQHGLLATPAVSTLDAPPLNGILFAKKLAPKALKLQLTSDLKDQAKLAAAAAMQTISTTAAVTQTGGAPSTNGSTNLASKPTVTDFLSIASELGAFTDTINGTSATLQANALGLTKYFANSPVFERWDSKYADALQPLTFTVTLNIAQSSASEVPTAGSANVNTPASIASVILPANNASFSSFGANYTIYRPYSPQDPKFQTAWSDAITSSQSALDAATVNLSKAMNALIGDAAAFKEMTQNMDTPLATWHLAGAAAERSANFDGFVSAYANYDDAFVDYVLSRPDAPKSALALVQAVSAFNDATIAVLNKARGTPLATISYLYSTPVQKPAIHQFTLAVSELFRGGHPIKNANGRPTGTSDNTRTFMSGVQLTANFTASVYASLPTGAAYGRFRDVQFSGEFDKPFGGTLTSPRGIISAAGYGQYQYDPTVLSITQGNMVLGTDITLPGDAQVLLGRAGWLSVVQGKLVINLSQGLKLPVAIKWSNRTDLLQANDVRGQIGLSYDLSALSKLLSSAGH
ncbi:MAG: hypothetical protein WDN23_18240 [Edaphobacter sp.]